MQSRNRNYGKLIEGVIHYAPKTVCITNKDGSKSIYPNPNAEQYLAADDGPWKKIVEHRLPPKDGYSVVMIGWTETATEIIRLYKYELITASIEDYDAAMEDHITSERMARGYTTREPSAYVNSPNPRFAQDAVDWANFLAEVMQYGLAVLNEYQQTGVAPVTLDEFKVALPACKWTEA